MMTSNGQNQASQNGSTKPPHLADQIALIKRRRFRRIKNAPLSDSFPSSINTTNALPKPHIKSVYDQFYPSYLRAVLVVAVYLAVGTLCFTLLRKQISGRKTNDVLDGLYFTILTMTCIGYGDLVPTTKLTMLLAYLFGISGLVIVGFFVSKLAELLVEKQEGILVRALHINENIGEAEIHKKMRTKKERNKCIIMVVLLVVLMIAGTGLLVAVEDFNFLHAFYCVIGTLTGLGYIDKCFSTAGGRAFALLFILLGTIYLAQLLYTFTVLHTERRKKSFVKWVLVRKTTGRDLEAADFDGDGIVVAAEFVIYKLLEMGKISRDDITPIMEEFEKLDFDKTGTLSASDLFFGQSLLVAADVLATQMSV